MAQMVKVTVPCPYKNTEKPDGHECRGFHVEETLAAEYYVELMKSSYFRAPEAVGEFSSRALTALLERIVELEEKVRELSGDDSTSLQNSE